MYRGVSKGVDWNDDGNMDLVVSDTSARMWYALNTPVDGVPTFGAIQPITYTTGGQVINPTGKAAMWVVDWDDDGKKDIITGGEGDATAGTGQCYFFRNTGTDAAPTFAAPVPIGGGTDFGWRTSPVAVDWNGDGKKEHRHLQRLQPPDGSPVCTAFNVCPPGTPPPITSMISQSLMPRGTSIRPVWVILPVRAKTLVPLLCSEPMLKCHFPRRR